MQISSDGPSKFSALFLLGVMVALGVFPLDVMLPSYPSLANFFGIQINDVTLFVAIFAVGFSISQVIIGPLSDRYGRGVMLRYGLVISVVGICGCVLSRTAVSFSIFRLVQGVGCGCFVLAQAIVQDVFTQEDRQRIRIFLLSLSGVCISFSPLFGTFLEYIIGWEGSFYVFGALALVIFIQATIFFPKRAGPAPDFVPEPLQIFKRYAEIFGSRPFVFSWFTSALAFSCHFGFIAISPIIFLDFLKVTPFTYSVVLLTYGGAYVAGGLVATRLSRKLSIDAQINLGLLISFLSGVIMILLMQYSISIITVAIPMIICTVGTTMVRPAAASRAMEMFTNKAGASAAAGGTIVFVTGGLVSVLLSYLPFPPLESLAAFILLATATGYILNKVVASTKLGMPDVTIS